MKYEDAYKSPATRRMRQDQALTTLQGMIEGIAADGKLKPIEIDFCNHWMHEHERLAQASPFREMFLYIRNALIDGVITDGELEEILHGIEQCRGEGFYDRVTAGLQELEGIVAGLASDLKVTEVELRGLRTWCDAHAELRTHWPFDEIDALVTEVMKDGRVDPEENEKLVKIFSSFADVGAQRTLSANVLNGIGIAGISAVCPDISFADNMFCVTGASHRATRRNIEQLIKDRGGLVSPNVVKRLRYLIYCDAGNAAYAFSCYGRKIEKAVEFRRAGCPLVIVHESDFWDAVP